MDALLPLLIQIVTGVLGGQAIGAVLKQAAMGQLPKLLAGGIGGVAGGTLLSGLLGGADPAAAGALGGMASDVIGGAGGGAILTGLLGAVMGGMKK